MRSTTPALLLPEVTRPIVPETLAVPLLPESLRYTEMAVDASRSAGPETS